MNNAEAIETDLTLAEVVKRYPIIRKVPEDPGAMIRSVFYITGEKLDRAACTAAVGLEPTEFLETSMRGRYRPSGQPHIRPAEWSLEVEQEPSIEVEPCLIEVLDKVWPRRTEIQRLLAEANYRAGFMTNVIVFEYMPSCALTPVTLRRLAEFGVGWAFCWQDVSPPFETAAGDKPAEAITGQK